MKVLFILIAAIPFVANAQDLKKNNAGNKIAIGFSFSADYNYRTLKNNDGSSSSETTIDFRNDREKGKFSFTTGLNLNFKVSEKSEVQTGLLYSNKGYKTPKGPVYLPPIVPNAPTHYKSQVRFNYIEIPLKFNLISGKGKARFIGGAGFAANYLINESENLTIFFADGTESTRKQSDVFDYNKFNLFALISAGVEFKLKENILLRAEPTFRYGLLKIIDQPVSARLWNVGLNLCVYVSLKNLR